MMDKVTRRKLLEKAGLDPILADREEKVSSERNRADIAHRRDAIAAVMTGPSTGATLSLPKCSGTGIHR